MSSTATTTLTMTASPAVNGRSNKSTKKQSKVITLKVSPKQLAQFLPKKKASKTPSSASSPAPIIEDVPQVPHADSQDIQSESNSTPAPTQEASTPNGNANKKGPVAALASTNGIKRLETASPGPDASGKARGKPGPKKKPRLDDGTIDHQPKPAVPATTNHKLGPKANTGNINANLRALDRSGTPCRRWQKKGFQLKSFTGITWELPTWKGDRDDQLVNGGSPASKDISMHDSSDMKPSESDTAHGSTAGDQVDKMEISTPAASSPVIMPTAPALAIQG